MARKKALEDVSPIVNETVNEKKIAVVVNCEKLNLRTTPSIKGEVKTVLSVGTELEVISIEKEFTKVNINGVEGFVMNDFITLK